MAYDKAEWHYGGEFPEDLPDEDGATHIGIFLGWAIRRGLAGELHLEDSPEALEAVRGGRMSGREFLLTECDEKFNDEDLSDEGNRFAAAYYDDRYVGDYLDCLDTDDAPTVYHIPNSAENQARMEALLDRRFEEWKREHAGGARATEPAAPAARDAPAKKPWWRFW